MKGIVGVPKMRKGKGAKLIMPKAKMPKSHVGKSAVPKNSMNKSMAKAKLPGGF